MLFLFYEIFGVITNLVGGWLGARIGLNKTMNIGLFLQIIALSMLLLPAEYLIVPWVMTAQALSGIAKDLNKMSAKSSIKMLVSSEAQGTLFKWVALLTGSKNALKGLGFFIGGLFMSMAVMLSLVWLLSLIKLKQDLGKSSAKPKFNEMLSKSRAINILSAARMLLFGARDVWFVIALPLFLASQLGWDHWTVGGFLALWVIGYGGVQSIAPLLLGNSKIPDGKTVTIWALLLCAIPGLIAIALTANWQVELALLGGLLLFGAVFAVNSSVHSYLIVSYAKSDGVSMDVGFYYMANAMGRLLGTVLSGWLYQSAGLITCLWVSSAMLVVTVFISSTLPKAKHA